MSIVGKAICFTGTLNAKRADASRLAVSAGASVTKSVTKKTQILVCGDGVGATKINAATAKGVEIWTEDKFNAAVVAALASASNAADSDEDEEEDEPAPAPARRTRASKRKAAATAAPKVKKPTAAEKRKAAAATAKSKKQAAAAAKQKKAPARRTRAKTAQASEDDDSDADDDTDPAPAKKKRARKSRPAGLAGVAAPVLGTSTASKAEVDEGLAQKDARLAKHASIYGEYEAKLAQVWTNSPQQFFCLTFCSKPYSHECNLKHRFTAGGKAFQHRQVLHHAAARGRWRWRLLYVVSMGAHGNQWQRSTHRALGRTGRGHCAI